MSEVIVFNFKDPRAHNDGYREQLNAIFFDTSTKKDFRSSKEKEDFRWKYLGFYLSHYPEYAWLAVRAEKVLGYVVGMPWSDDPSLYDIQPLMKNFSSHFLKYPAHLHINCGTSSQGMGIGKKLLITLENQLRAKKVMGLHILTGPFSENRTFYQKLGFSFSIEENNVLFMGKSFDEEC